MRTLILRDGKEYPLEFTVESMTELCAKYEDIEGFSKKLDSASLGEKMELLRWLLTTLINGGLGAQAVMRGEKLPEPLTERWVSMAVELKTLLNMEDTLFEVIAGALRREEMDEDPLATDPNAPSAESD